MASQDSISSSESLTGNGLALVNLLSAPIAGDVSAQSAMIRTMRQDFAVILADIAGIGCRLDAVAADLEGIAPDAERVVTQAKHDLGDLLMSYYHWLPVEH